MDIAIRAVVLYVFVFLLMRLVGRRELSSLQPFDLVLLIIIGDALQQGLTQSDYSVTGAMIAVGTFAVLQVGTSYLNFKVRWLRPALEGYPIVVVQDGEVIEANLKRERITREELAEAARIQQIGSISDVAWAVLETSGQISFIPKKSS
jgi:uncharacterized membrane protein YcaP (DUF421 family)